MARSACGFSVVLLGALLLGATHLLHGTGKQAVARKAPGRGARDPTRWHGRRALVARRAWDADPARRPRHVGVLSLGELRAGQERIRARGEQDLGICT